MNLIKNPNAWSCMLASVAMVLDKTTNELIEAVGHNGSQIIFPELPEPAKRRGFHIQEFIPMILKSGFAMTTIEVLPYSTPDGKHEFPIDFPNYEERFWNLMSNSIGILTGLRTRWRHAVAWNGKRIYDPIGSVYGHHDTQNFRIDVFYRFDKIKSL